MAKETQPQGKSLDNLESELAQTKELILFSKDAAEYAILKNKIKDIQRQIEEIKDFQADEAERNEILARAAKNNETKQRLAEQNQAVADGLAKIPKLEEAMYKKLEDAYLAILDVWSTGTTIVNTSRAANQNAKTLGAKDEDAPRVYGSIPLRFYSLAAERVNVFKDVFNAYAETRSSLQTQIEEHRNKLQPKDVTSWSLDIMKRHSYLNGEPLP